MSIQISTNMCLYVCVCAHTQCVCVRARVYIYNVGQVQALKMILIPKYNFTHFTYLQKHILVMDSPQGNEL